MVIKLQYGKKKSLENCAKMQDPKASHRPMVYRFEKGLGACISNKHLYSDTTGHRSIVWNILL